MCARFGSNVVFCCALLILLMPQATCRGDQEDTPIVLHVSEELIPQERPRPDDWPMYGYDAGNTFYNRNEETLDPPLAKVWEFESPGDVDGVVVSSGILLAGGSGDRKQQVFALDAQNGRHLWTFTLPGEGSGAMGMTPACSGDLAFFGGQNDRNVYAVHLRTGELRWQQGEIESMYSASPKVVEGVLYINSIQSGLWAFDAQTGKEKWRDKTQGRQAGIAVMANKLLRPGGAYGGVLVAFDTRSGEQQWVHADGLTSFGVAATDDMVFATYAGESPVEVTDGKDSKRFRYDRIAAFGTRDGRKVWETVLKEDALYSGLLVAGDSLYVTSRQESIYRLDIGTGKVCVERPFKEGWGQLIGTSKLIFVSSKDVILRLRLTPCKHGGQRQFRAFSTWPQPTGSSTSRPAPRSLPLPTASPMATRSGTDESSRAGPPNLGGRSLSGGRSRPDLLMVSLLYVSPAVAKLDRA